MRSTNYIQPELDILEELLPECPPELLDLYALLARTLGAATTLEDVHDAWAIWQNRINPAHMSLVPFVDLVQAVQELDRKYMEAIHQAALDIEFPC